MTNAEILTAITTATDGLNPGRTITTAHRQDLIDRSIKILGMMLRQQDPSIFYIRKSLTSTTNVFAMPSDIKKVLQVWDLKTTAGTITGASNATPIVIDCTAHGFTTADVITVHDVGGNDAANDTWAITVIGDDSYSLDGSTGDGAYASGGYCYQETSVISQIGKCYLRDATQTRKDRWYPRGTDIVVDYPDFDDDILIDYDKTPALANIPSDYHEGVVAFGIIHLCPHIDSESLQLYVNSWEFVVQAIVSDGGYTEKAGYVRDVIDYDSYLE